MKSEKIISSSVYSATYVLIRTSIHGPQWARCTCINADFVPTLRVNGAICLFACFMNIPTYLKNALRGEELANIAKSPTI